MWSEKLPLEIGHYWIYGYPDSDRYDIWYALALVTKLGERLVYWWTGGEIDIKNCLLIWQKVDLPDIPLELKEQIEMGRER